MMTIRQFFKEYVLPITDSDGNFTIINKYRIDKNSFSSMTDTISYIKEYSNLSIGKITLNDKSIFLSLAEELETYLTQWDYEDLLAEFQILIRNKKIDEFLYIL